MNNPVDRNSKGQAVEGSGVRKSGADEYRELKDAGLSDHNIQMLRNTGADHRAILAYALENKPAINFEIRHATIPQAALIGLGNAARYLTYTRPNSIYSYVDLPYRHACVGVWGDGGNGSYEWFLWDADAAKLTWSNVGFGCPGRITFMNNPVNQLDKPEANQGSGMRHSGRVIGWTKGIPNSGMGKYALARLECGHVASVQLIPCRGECFMCGQESELREAGKATICGGCGSQSFRFTFVPDAHNEAHYATKIGDSVPCQQCASLAADVAFLAELDPASVFRARFRNGTYWLYRRDTTSPSGVMLIRGVAAVPEIDAILTQKRISPLSPTEGV